MSHFLTPRSTRLFFVLAGFFVTNALVAEIIGVKIFALEPTLGINPFEWRLFGQSGSLQLTAGVLLWPVVFVMTDLINEYFGPKAVRFLSWLTAGLIVYAFIMIFVAIALVPADFWRITYKTQNVPDMQAAFAAVFGQGLWIIGGSLIAFLLGQILDARVFQYLRKKTGEKHLWRRATFSTFLSQFIDSFVVLYIAFVLGPMQWPASLFLAVGTVNYAYKFIVAIIMIPVIYGIHALIDRYLGKELSAQLRHTASGRAAE
jgi:queuosine precursor transporter